MARPKINVDAEKTRLLDVAEQLLARYGAAKVTVSDIAAQCGMSQSNVYRFFPNKAALMSAVAENWFAEFENALVTISWKETPGEEALHEFLTSLLTMKRARFDENPELFLAYLELAAQNMKAVARHVELMSEVLLGLVERWLKDEGLPVERSVWARDIIDDATLLFRDPNLIARRRPDCTDLRLASVIDTTLRGIRDKLSLCDESNA